MEDLKTVVVTGANGFVGRSVCAALCSGSFRVKAIVRNASSSHSKGSVWAATEDDPRRLQVIAVPNSFTDVDWQSVLAGANAIVHLAARVHVMGESNVPRALEEYRSVNVKGTLALARAAASAGVGRFVYLSSIKVNGEGPSGSGRVQAFREEDPVAPQDPYGISKWEAEQALSRVAKEDGLKVSILRPPLVYGPGVKANFYQLMKMVANRVPLPFALVRNRRSLIYVENLADAIRGCVESTADAVQTFLVSDGHDVSTPEIIRALASGLGRPAILLPVPVSLLSGAATTIGKRAAAERLLGSLTVNCEQIRKSLNWRPPFTFDTGIHRTASWYLNQNSKPDPDFLRALGSERARET